MSSSIPSDSFSRFRFPDYPHSNMGTERDFSPTPPLKSGREKQQWLKKTDESFVVEFPYSQGPTKEKIYRGKKGRANDVFRKYGVPERASLPAKQEKQPKPFTPTQRPRTPMASVGGSFAFESMNISASQFAPIKPDDDQAAREAGFVLAESAAPAIKVPPPDSPIHPPPYLHALTPSGTLTPSPIGLSEEQILVRSPQQKTASQQHDMQISEVPPGDLLHFKASELLASYQAFLIAQKAQAVLAPTPAAPPSLEDLLRDPLPRSASHLGFGSVAPSAVEATPKILHKERFLKEIDSRLTAGPRAPSFKDCMKAWESCCQPGKTMDGTVGLVGQFELKPGVVIQVEIRKYNLDEMDLRDVASLRKLSNVFHFPTCFKPAKEQYIFTFYHKDKVPLFYLRVSETDGEADTVNGTKEVSGTEVMAFYREFRAKFGSPEIYLYDEAKKLLETAVKLDEDRKQYFLRNKVFAGATWYQTQIPTLACAAIRGWKRLPPKLTSGRLDPSVLIDLNQDMDLYGNALTYIQSRTLEHVDPIFTKNAEGAGPSSLRAIAVKCFGRDKRARGAPVEMHYSNMTIKEFWDKLNDVVKKEQNAQKKLEYNYLLLKVQYALFLPWRESDLAKPSEGELTWFRNITIIENCPVFVDKIF